MVFSEVIGVIKGNFSLFTLIFLVIIVLILFNLILSFVKRSLLRKAKTKGQISNIKVFTRILYVILVVLVVVVAFFSYIGSWTGLGVFAGLFTAVLGFALQKPITGVAAWIMVVLKRPFRVGDRIIIGDVKGEVYDITLTHIYIDEIGGSIDSDQLSGRNVMVPNHLIFENNIINYTLTHDYVLGEVAVGIAYESNLDKAMKIVREAADKFVKEYSKTVNREISVRIKMEASSINVQVRFFAPVKIMQEVSSNITKEIYDRIKKESDVDIAYPHTEIIFKKKKRFRK